MTMYVGFVEKELWMDLQIIAEFGEEFKVDTAKRMQELDARECGIDSGEYDSMRKLIEHNCR